MTELPLKAFCLVGIDGEEKIEMTIEKVFEFPKTTSYEGGYDFTGTLIIDVGSYKVYSEEFYSSTGILFRLNASLMKCYDCLKGTAEYKHLLENCLTFEVKMTEFGHAIISGVFREASRSPTELVFEFETDQTCILDAIDDLKKIEKLFGDGKGV